MNEAIKLMLVPLSSRSASHFVPAPLFPPPGVPRIKEIINAAKRINTPIITAELESETSVQTARVVKGRIERTSLADLSKSIELVCMPGNCYVKIVLDRATIDALQLSVTRRTVTKALENAKKLKLKKNIGWHTRDPDTIYIYPPQAGALRSNAARLQKTTLLEIMI